MLVMKTKNVVDEDKKCWGRRQKNVGGKRQKMLWKETKNVRIKTKNVGIRRQKMLVKEDKNVGEGDKKMLG